MVKTVFKALGKIVISGILAFAILTLFCVFYYNGLISFVNEDGSTDYKWEANQFYSHGTEGFAWGRTNNDGFTNMFDYEDGMQIDVLVMGSSHMAAFEVAMDQSTASQLNALLEEETVYNIGMPSHTFLSCVANFPAALEAYRPTKYVVIETDTVLFPDEALAAVIQEETAAVTAGKWGGKKGIIELIRRNPFLRLAGKQIDTYLENVQMRDAQEGSHGLTPSERNEALLAELFGKMSALCEAYGSKVIIAYHPSVDIAADGSMQLSTGQSEIAPFKRQCEANGILFLDMSERFQKEYESAYILPYGFANSSVGNGHMNRYGHAMMADELYRLMGEDAQ